MAIFFWYQYRVPKVLKVCKASDINGLKKGTKYKNKGYKLGTKDKNTLKASDTNGLQEGTKGTKYFTHRQKKIIDIRTDI